MNLIFNNIPSKNILIIDTNLKIGRIASKFSKFLIKKNAHFIFNIKLKNNRKNITNIMKYTKISLKKINFKYYTAYFKNKYLIKNIYGMLPKHLKNIKIY